MELELAGKVVLITGGSRGIGLAIAKAFLQEGCRVAIAARNEIDLRAAAAVFGPSCSHHVADVTDEAACISLAADVQARWQQFDVLVTCVGSGASAPPGQENAAEWQRMIALNLFSATNMIAAAQPHLARAKDAAIVCISSICGGEVVAAAPVAYSAAKAALNAAIRGLAWPLARQDIRINGVAPGNIRVENGGWARRLAEHPEAVTAMLNAEVAQARLGLAVWVADAVLHLASPRASFTTGTIHVVDGGQSRG